MIYIIAQCPDTHPYAYGGGKYCCQYGVENLQSEKCQSDAYTTCDPNKNLICIDYGRYYFKANNITWFWFE